VVIVSPVARGKRLPSKKEKTKNDCYLLGDVGEMLGSWQPLQTLYEESSAWGVRLSKGGGGDLRFKKNTASTQSRRLIFFQRGRLRCELVEKKIKSDLKRASRENATPGTRVNNSMEEKCF